MTDLPSCEFDKSSGTWLLSTPATSYALRLVGDDTGEPAGPRPERNTESVGGAR